jgi:hypothetical protein
MTANKSVRKLRQSRVHRPVLSPDEEVGSALLPIYSAITIVALVQISSAASQQNRNAIRSTPWTVSRLRQTCEKLATKLCVSCPPCFRADTKFLWGQKFPLACTGIAISMRLCPCATGLARTLDPRVTSSRIVTEASADPVDAPVGTMACNEYEQTTDCVGGAHHDKVAYARSNEASLAAGTNSPPQCHGGSLLVRVGGLY